MKTAMLLIALLPGFAHAVNKCVVAGKVMYTDAPCERFGGKTAKTFTPQANMVESQETADVKRKIASGEMTVTQTRVDGNGLRETRTLQPHEITRDVMDDLKRNRSVAPPAIGQPVSPPLQQAAQPAAPARSANRDVCKQIDNALALNASAARQPNSAATQEQLAANRRNLHEQRGRNECEKGEGM